MPGSPREGDNPRAGQCPPEPLSSFRCCRGSKRALWGARLGKTTLGTSTFNECPQLSLTGLSEEHPPCPFCPRCQSRDRRAIQHWAAVSPWSRAGCASPGLCQPRTAPCGDSQPHTPTPAPAFADTPRPVCDGAESLEVLYFILMCHGPSPGAEDADTGAPPQRCPAENPSTVLLLLKGISESLSSVRAHRADAPGADAGVSLSPVPGSSLRSPALQTLTARPGSQGRRRAAGRGLSQGRRNNFRSLHSLFLSGNTSC